MPADCDQLGPPERLRLLQRTAAARGVPLHATLALTYRCNLQCVHCYARSRQDDRRAELTAAEILSSMGEAVEAGCLSVLLTGGEPLMRPDFDDIYLGLRRMGLYVKLFTNATRITPHVVEVLSRSPPSLVEVSIYGSSPESYERVTGCAEAYAQSQHGVQLLREAGLPVRLKTVLMTHNRADFSAIRCQGAADLRRFRYDPVIVPRWVGDREVEALRVPPREVAELEAREMPELVPQWAQRLQARTPSPPAEQSAPALYGCAAGVVSFYLNPQGWIQPCVSATNYRADVRVEGLVAGWHRVRAAIRVPRAKPGHACVGCPDRAFCGSCPAVAALETGSEQDVLSYACILARQRALRVRQQVPTGVGACGG